MATITAQKSLFNESKTAFKKLPFTDLRIDFDVVKKYYSHDIPQKWPVVFASKEENSQYSWCERKMPILKRILSTPLIFIVSLEKQFCSYRLIRLTICAFIGNLASAATL